MELHSFTKYLFSSFVSCKNCILTLFKDNILTIYNFTLNSSIVDKLFVGRKTHFKPNKQNRYMLVSKHLYCLSLTTTVAITAKLYKPLFKLSIPSTSKRKPTLDLVSLKTNFSSLQPFHSDFLLAPS